MKLIYAIVRNDNEDDVMDSLIKDHFQVTKLASTGGFLRKGNSTLMIATQDDMVDECIELIKKQCGKRQKITVNMPYVSGTSMGTYTMHCRALFIEYNSNVKLYTRIPRVRTFMNESVGFHW